MAYALIECGRCEPLQESAAQQATEELKKRKRKRRGKKNGLSETALFFLKNDAVARASHLTAEIQQPTLPTDLLGDDEGERNRAVEMATGNVTDGEREHKDGEAEGEGNADLRSSLPGEKASGTGQ